MRTSLSVHLSMQHSTKGRKGVHRAIYPFIATEANAFDCGAATLDQRKAQAHVRETEKSRYREIDAEQTGWKTLQSKFCCKFILQVRSWVQTVCVESDILSLDFRGKHKGAIYAVCSSPGFNRLLPTCEDAAVDQALVAKSV